MLHVALRMPRGKSGIVDGGVRGPTVRIDSHFFRSVASREGTAVDGFEVLVARGRGAP